MLELSVKKVRIIRANPLTTNSLPYISCHFSQQYGSIAFTANFVVITRLAVSLQYQPIGLLWNIH